MSERPEDTQGFRWRVSLSIVASLGWLVFLIIWLFFYASAFNIYQNIAVFVASILIFFGIMGGSWASWGMKHRGMEHQQYWEDAVREEIRKIVKEELENQKPKRPARRKR